MSIEPDSCTKYKVERVHSREHHDHLGRNKLRLDMVRYTQCGYQADNAIVIPR